MWCCATSRSASSRHFDIEDISLTRRRGSRGQAGAGRRGGQGQEKPKYISSWASGGVTVDELFKYRRRRPSAGSRPQDSLGVLDGKFNHLKTEYRRRYYRRNSDFFRNLVRLPKPEDFLKPDGDLSFVPEYREKFVGSFSQRPSPLRPTEGITLEKDSLDVLTENLAKYTVHPITPRKLCRKSTTLKPGGEIVSNETESHEQFVEFIGVKRPELTRKSTTLKIEGEQETTTEANENFVPHPVLPRPSPVKHEDNITVGSDPSTLVSESFERFSAPYQGVEGGKPDPSKRVENLRLQGENMWTGPEYRTQFVEYPRENYVKSFKGEGITRPEDISKLEGLGINFPKEKIVPRPRVDHLKMSSGFANTSELKSEFRNFPRERNIAKPHPTHLKQEGQMEKSSVLKSDLKNFPRTRKISKPPPANLKQQGAMEKSSEFKSEFTDFPRERPELHRTDSTLKPEGDIIATTESKSEYVELPSMKDIAKPPEDKLQSEGDVGKTTESRAEFVDFHPERNIAKPHGSHLHPEGEVEKTSEFKSEFVDLHPERQIAKPLEDHLKPEGDMEKSTISQSEYVEMPNIKDVAKPHGAHLQPEGDMEKVTENKLEYVELPTERNIAKPHGSHLQPEGEMNLTTESSEFKDTPRSRPIIYRTASSLRSEGPMTHETEVHTHYTDFPRERPILHRRPSILRPEGDIEVRTETSEYRDFPRERPVIHRPKSILKPEGGFEGRTESSSYFKDMTVRRPRIARRSPVLQLEGEILISPEYSTNYVDFPRERPRVQRHKDHLKYGDYDYQDTNLLERALRSGRPLRIVGTISPTTRRKFSKSRRNSKSPRRIIEREDTSDSDQGRPQPTYRMTVENYDDARGSSAYDSPPNEDKPFVVLGDDGGNRWLRGSERNLKPTTWRPSWGVNAAQVVVE